MVGLYPSRPMYLMASIWEASDWATLNGQIKIDWKHEPFIADFNKLHIDGCVVEEKDENFNLHSLPCSREESLSIWDLELSTAEERLLQNVTKRFRSYAWSRDPARWGQGIGLFNSRRESRKNITKKADSCKASVQMTENCSF